MMNHILKYLSIFCVIALSHSWWHSFAYAQNAYPELETIKEYYINTRGKNPEKIKKIKEIVRKYENNQDFNYQLGKLFIDIFRPLDAEIILKKLYEQHPKDKYEIAYGQALLAQRKATDILFVVKLNGLSDNLKAHKYFLHAHAYFFLEKHELALEMVEKALALESNIPYFFILKARLLAALGQAKDSLALIDDIIKTNTYTPDRINTEEIDFLRAENYTNTLDYIKALDIYNSLINKNKQNYPAYSGRAMLYLLLGNLADAFDDGMLLMTHDPSNRFAPFIIASILNAQGQYDEALLIYKRHNSEYFLPSLLLHAEISFNAKKYKQARLLLNKYLKQDANNPKALRLRGILKLKEGNAHDALGDLELAYSEAPDDSQVIIPLAQAYYHIGNYKKAEMLYEILEKDFPLSKEIAYLAFELSCKFSKVQIKKPELCAEPVQSEIARQAFEALQFMYIGYQDKALSGIKKLVDIYPTNLTVLKHYARILKNTDDIDKAVDILLNIVKQDSNNTQSLSELYGIYKSGKSSVDIINQIHTLFDTNKNAVNAGYYLANFYYKNKNYTKALNITQEMIKRNTTQFKPVELYEMIFKIIINRPDRFAKEITYYLEKYQGLDKKNPLLIRLLRQNIMQTNFKETIFKNLDIPQGEETAKDYQIYAEYLIFVNAHNAARMIYNNGIHKFSDNFELFNSAFDFFKNPSELMALKNKFSHHNKNYHTILQAKLYLAQQKKQQAVALLKEKFKIDYHGLIADLLLTIDQTPETIALVDNNVKTIKDYSYEATYRLAEILYKKSRLNEAANLLLPFLNTKKTDINYKLLLAQSSFYADFTMSNRLMNELVQEFPHRNDFLIHYIAYEVRNRNYKKAINLFEKNKPTMQEHPNVYFSYAYALLHTKKEKQGIKILHELIDTKQEFLERYNAVTLVEKFKNP